MQMDMDSPKKMKDAMMNRVLEQMPASKASQVKVPLPSNLPWWKTLHSFSSS